MKKKTIVVLVILVLVPRFLSRHATVNVNFHNKFKCSFDIFRHECMNITK